MTPETIILYPQRIGAVSYLPADKIDIDASLQAGLLNEGLVTHLRKLKQIGEPTRENFPIAVAQRPHGSPWPPRGFTEAYLQEKGWIETAPEQPAASRSTKERPAPRKMIKVDTVELTDEKVQVGANFLQPVKNGKFTLWTAAAPDGRILRDKNFRSRENGVAFLESLSTEAPGPDTSQQEPAAEASHDGDIQSGAGDAGGQDPSADRG